MVTNLGNRLRELVERVDGAQAAMLVDQDGLPIDNYLHPESSIEVELLSAECNAVLARAREASSQLEFGKLGEISLVTERYLIFCTFVGGEYFLILALSRAAILGKARFYLQRLAFSIRQEV